MSHRLITLAATVGLLVLVAALTGPSAGRRIQATGTGAFVVAGNTILDPTGRPFIVKGIVSPYGPFAGYGNGPKDDWYHVNFDNAPTDDSVIASLHANLVRIFVDTTDANPTAEAHLQHVVQLARSHNFVVEIANSYSTYTQSLPWLSYLARTYKGDPYVWLQPMNEPNCTSPADDGTPIDTSPSRCGDTYPTTRAYTQAWQNWQAEERAYIRTIRAAGMSSPIVVNALNWSWDLSQIARYPLGDNNIIFGAHRYANDCAHFDNTPNAEFPQGQIADVNHNWANLSSTFPIIVDEVGNDNGPQPHDAGCNGSGHRTWNAFTWLQDFLPWMTSWIRARGGAGMIGFTWHWSDDNTMTGSPQRAANDEVLTNWGNLFNTQYLQKVGH